MKDGLTASIGKREAGLDPPVLDFWSFGRDTQQNYEILVRFCFSKRRVDVSIESGFPGKIVICRKECNQTLRIQLLDADQAVKDGRGGPPVLRLNQQTRGCDIIHLIEVEIFVASRQHQKRLFRFNHPGQPVSGLKQQRFAAYHAAELLGPVITRNLPR